ncbi:uncharacterized protein LOC131622850 [Vicia villosa]|uniref:uncharacterized protein LOC131622850 n=1 Tax=Vicia villosa TaxID=3911 RepID=UPI00273A7D0F|nr:uncharacterized protein LOC131622850 [Vicia villosa]
MAQPRACFILWLTCHGKLPTKDRLLRLGMLDNITCCLYSEDESIDHLFFMCPLMKHVWKEVLDWIQVQHCPREWRHEPQWIIYHTKGKGNKTVILKTAIAEAVYMLWTIRNENYFWNKVHDKDIGK